MFYIADFTCENLFWLRVIVFELAIGIEIDSIMGINTFPQELMLRNKHER